MHAALKLQCGWVTGNKKFTIGGLKYVHIILSSKALNEARNVFVWLCL